MTTHEFLTSAWIWSPWVLIVCVAALAAPGLLRRRSSLRDAAWLAAGSIVLCLTLCSPVDALADGYLFSAHMLQHLLLLLIVPALFLLGIPSLPSSGRSTASPGYPAFAWLSGVGGMWLWHEPALCDAAVANVWVHRLQYVSLVLMGAVFWSPIIGPWTKRRLDPLKGMIYLFTACVGCTVLGIIIVFAPVGVCPVYLHPSDRLGILPLIRGGWGLTPEKDQQLGGLLMWVPACLIYLGGIVLLLFRWYGAAGEKPRG